MTTATSRSSGPATTWSPTCRPRARPAGPNIIQQCLDAGLIDEVHIELVPVLHRDGIRFFGDLAHAPVMFDDPTIIAGTHVTHLRYKVRRTAH
jgi:hypothetical protein